MNYWIIILNIFECYKIYTLKTNTNQLAKMKFRIVGEDQPTYWEKVTFCLQDQMREVNQVKYEESDFYK